MLAHACAVRDLATEGGRAPVVHARARGLVGLPGDRGVSVGVGGGGEARDRGRRVVVRVRGHVVAADGPEDHVVHALDGARAARDGLPAPGQALERAGGGARGQHRLEAARLRALDDREAQLPVGVGHVLERGAVAPVEPVHHLRRRHHRNVALLRGGHDVVRVRLVAVVRVRVHGDHAVPALGAEGVVEQRVDLRGHRHLRLVRDLGHRLVHVDHRAVEIGEALREAGAREEAGLGQPAGRAVVVVIRVEADAVGLLELRLGGPVAPHDAVRAVGRRLLDARPGGGERGQLAGQVAVERLRGEVVARGEQVQGHLEAGGLVGGGLAVRHRRVGIEVRGRAHALPVGHRAARRARRLEPVEVRGRAVVGVVVTGHHDGGLLAARQVPEARQRGLVAVHLRDQVGQQALLLVRLRHGDLAHVHPVGLDVAGLRAVEEVVRANAVGGAVALLPGPGRVALARVDDRAREVVREGGRLAAGAAHVTEGDGGVRRGRRRVRVETRDRGGAVERPAVRGAVELKRLALDARCGRVAGVHLHVLVGARAAGAAEAEQAGELRVRPHRDQVPARLHPVGQQGHLGVGDRRRGQQDHAVAGELVGGHRAIGGVELVESLRAQDLGVVAAEGIVRGRDDLDRAARALRGRLPGDGEGPDLVGGQRVPGRVGHAA